MPNKNVCVYCSSPAFGPGCAFSPSGIHFHAGDPKRCCFCNSPASGPGCPFNPHSKVHVHGVEFNSMVKETIDKSITLGYLMSALSSPITEMKAYELGIIDENGKKLKNPKTSEEINSYGSEERYILGLKESMGKDIDLIHDSLDVQMESVISLEDYAKVCESSLNIQEKFEDLGNQFNEIVASAYNSGLSRASIEKLIIDSILEK